MSSIIDDALVGSFSKFDKYPFESEYDIFDRFPKEVEYDNTYGGITYYGLVNDIDRWSIEKNICFGNLFRYEEGDDDSFEYFVVTVGTVIDSSISNNLANEWYDFVLNIYPGIKDNVELHVKVVYTNRGKIKVLSGYSVDLTKVPIEPMFHTMQLMRATGEFPSTIKKWKYLKNKGVHPIVALWIAHRVLPDMGLSPSLRLNKRVKFGDEGRGGGHVSMPKSIDMKGILNGTVFDKYDFDRTINDRMREPKEILSILHGDFGPIDLINNIDGIKRDLVQRDIFGFTVSAIKQDDSTTIRNIINAALKVQKEYGYA